MFDKLFGMMNKIEPEVKAQPKSVSREVPVYTGEHKTDDKGILIGYDYLKKSNVSQLQDIEQKIEMLQELKRQMESRK